MFDFDNIVHKEETEAEIVLTDGTSMTGVFYTMQDQRLIDLLNDHRRFIPYRDSEGMLTLIGKTNIDRIMPIDGTLARKTTAPRWLGERRKTPSIAH